MTSYADVTISIWGKLPERKVGAFIKVIKEEGLEIDSVNAREGVTRATLTAAVKDGNHPLTLGSFEVRWGELPRLTEFLQKQGLGYHLVRQPTAGLDGQLLHCEPGGEVEEYLIDRDGRILIPVQLVWDVLTSDASDAAKLRSLRDLLPLQRGNPIRTTDLILPPFEIVPASQKPRSRGAALEV